MKKAAKIIALLLTAIFMISLCACGTGSTKTNSDQGKTNQSTPAPESNDNASGVKTPENETKDPVELNIVSTFPSGNVNYEAAVLIADKVTELTEGQVKLNFLGGSEIFSGAAGAEAVMNGALDMVFTAADYFTGFAPEAAAICASDMTYEEMKASGALDYINEVFAKHSVRLLYVVDEVGISGTQIFTSDVIDSLEDLKGLPIRTTGTVQGDVLTSLGCAATPLGLGEIFTALEQGLVKGYCGPAYLGGAMGFFEYCKCVISTEIARGGSSLLINEDAWARIPEDVQKLLLDSFTQINDAEVELYTEYVDNNMKALTEAGGQIVELSEEDAAALKELCSEYAWKSIESTVDADTYAKLVEVFVK